MFVTTKKSMHFLHSTRGCSGLHCTNQAATASSHRIRRTHRNLLLRYPPTDGTDAHRILVPPSLDNCRRVWHPAIPTQPS